MRLEGRTYPQFSALSVRAALEAVEEWEFEGRAAAIAALEVEFAVGLLAGVGATALLATRPGAEARGEVLSKSKAARDEVVRKGRAAFDKAKSKLKRKEAPPPVVSVGDAPPPTG